MKTLRRIFTGLFGILITTFVAVSPAFAVTYSSGPVNPYSFSIKPGSSQGSAVLIWYDDGGAVRYDVVYGTTPSQPIYGQINIPFQAYAENTDTISYLNPGTTYYFSLLGYMKDQAQPFISGPIAITASSRSGQVYKTSTVGKTNPYALYVTANSQPGTADIYWYDDGGAYKYDLLYGTNPNNFTFGVPNIGFIKNSENHFTVNFLGSHQTYYFLLRGYVNGQGNPYLSGPAQVTTK